MLVVKIGGCNGSGKSSLVRELIDLIEAEPVPHPTKPAKHIAYYAAGRRPTYVLGSYQNTCGGMDTIMDKHDRYALVTHYADPKTNNIVIFEGLITGKTYGALGVLSDEPAQHGKWLYVFMDTPFEVCVARVLNRRKLTGNNTPFDPERTMRPTFKSIQSVRRRAIENDHWVYDVDHKYTPGTSAAQLLDYIKELHAKV